MTPRSAVNLFNATSLWSDHEEQNLKLSNSTEQNHIWEADSHSYSQQIFRLFRNPKVQYSVHNSHPVVPFLSQMNPLVHTIRYHFLKLDFNILLVSQLVFRRFFWLCYSLSVRPNCCPQHPVPTDNQQVPSFNILSSHIHFLLFRSFLWISPRLIPCVRLRNMTVSVSPRPTP